MTKYPLNIAPGASTIVETRGSFLYFESASAGGLDTSIKVVISGSKGGEVILQVGQGFKLDMDYDRLTVSNNLGQGTIIGQLVIADGSFFDHRVIGTVAVIDGGKARSLAGTAFSATVYQGALAANVAHVQIWNPVGSGKNIIVEQILALAGAGGSCTVDFTQTQLTTAGSACGAKKAGAANSVMQCLSQNLAAALPALPLMILSTGTYFSPKEPYVVPPGYGMVFIQQISNVALQIAAEWYEEPV